ncbi:MAG TPA: Fe-S cluster assembly protein SufD [Ohtaekwangia sp.]
MSAVATEKNITADVAAVIEKSITTLPSQMQQRKEALNAFKKQGLPLPKSEEYKFTPVTRFLEKNFDLNAKNPESKINASPFIIAGLDAHVLVFVNGIYSAEQSSINASGVTVSTLKDAVQNNQAASLKYLGTIADVNADAFAAWNTATWNDGVFIHVPKNVIVDKPVVLYHIHDAQNGQVISHSRNLIVVERSAEVTVVEKFDSAGSAAHFSTTVTEAIVEENAGLNFYSIQNDSGARHQVGSTQIQQANHSRVNTFTFSLDGKLIRNNLHMVLDGEGIESHMYGLYLLGKDTLADNHTVADHRKPNSFSNELYKGVMDGNSRGVFNGKIYVRPDAQKTNAFQANRNILLTDKATVNTKPQLEIWADDVKCSHGCTSGQLDEEALFYLQTRGINKETAQAMMLYAFAGEVLDAVKDPVIKTYIDQVISERLHKNF